MPDWPTFEHINPSAHVTLSSGNPLKYRFTKVHSNVPNCRRLWIQVSILVTFYTDIWDFRLLSLCRTLRCAETMTYHQTSFHLLLGHIVNSETKRRVANAYVPLGAGSQCPHNLWDLLYTHPRIHSVWEWATKFCMMCKLNYRWLEHFFLVDHAACHHVQDRVEQCLTSYSDTTLLLVVWSLQNIPLWTFRR